jgi:hypothetical protein
MISLNDDIEISICKIFDTTDAIHFDDFINFIQYGSKPNLEKSHLKKSKIECVANRLLEEGLSIKCNEQAKVHEKTFISNISKQTDDTTTLCCSLVVHKKLSFKNCWRKSEICKQEKIITYSAFDANGLQQVNSFIFFDMSEYFYKLLLKDLSEKEVTETEVI